MRGITLGLFSYIPIVYDTDFQTNVLDVADTFDIAIPPNLTLYHLNALMKGKKNIGVYQISDTLSNFALGRSGYDLFRLIDWKLTGNIYAPHGGLIYKENGIQGNGVNAYLDTKFNPALMGINYTLNNAGRGFVVIQDFADPISEAAGTTASNRTNMSVSGSSVQRINAGAGSSSVSVNLYGNGLKTISRDSSDSIRLTNKDTQTQITQPSNEIVSASQVLLRTQSVYSSTNTFLNYFMSGSISYDQSQSFRTIYNQFLSDLGLEPIA